LRSTSTRGSQDSKEVANVEKFNQLAGYAFENGIRFHLDSVQAYKNDSYATAYHLALIASEEIGKALMLEEYYFQHFFNGWDEKDPHIKKFLESIFSAHRTKQKWFGRMANDFLSDHPPLKPASVLVQSMMEGVMEEVKQNTTYVGLTKKGKKVDLNGKMVVPRLFAQPEKARKQITLNNDFMAVYTSGFLRGMYGTDSYYIAINLEKGYLDTYLSEWEFKGRLAAKILKEHEGTPYKKRPLEDWDE